MDFSRSDNCHWDAMGLGTATFAIGHQNGGERTVVGKNH
jgi:hypothetical protein